LNDASLDLEPEEGVEPSSAVYETAALPLSYTGTWKWMREWGSNPHLRLQRPASCHWTIPQLGRGSESRTRIFGV
jgi:hypothetical protein